MNRILPGLYLAWAALCVPHGAAGQAFDPHPVFGPNSLAKTHPGWDFSDLLGDNPAALGAGFSAHIGGMAFLPDGRLAVADFPAPEAQPWKGGVWLLEGVQTGDKAQVKAKLFAGNLYGPTGLTVVNGDVYVIDANSLKKLTDKDGNGTAEVAEITRSWHQNGGQPAVADLTYHDGYFYSAIGSSGGVAVDGASIAGGTAKIGMDGKVQQLCTGYRNTGGGGVNSKGEIFATDNQGEWIPSSKLIHVVPGRYYGFGGLTRNGVAASPPAVWIPEGTVSPPGGNASTWAVGLSPSTVLPIDSGAFAGQMLMGDIRYGNVDRIFLERVQGEYQGALFHFSGGFRAGIYRMAWGPDGALYLGGLGGNFYTWSWKDNNLEDDWGLYRLKRNAKSVFEMAAVRAKAGGFEIEFTLPAKAGLAAGDFKVQSWRYAPTGSYGGPQMDMKTLAVKSLQPSADRTRLFLEIPGLEEGRVVHFELDSNAVTAAAGGKPWTAEAWYTLNKLSTEAPTAANPGILPFAGKAQVWPAAGGHIAFSPLADGEYRIRDAAGTQRETGPARAGGVSQSSRTLRPGLYLVALPGQAPVRVILH